jgi:hypothetical protein
VRWETVVGVDWSGATDDDGAMGTYAATIVGGRVVDIRNAGRKAVVEHVDGLAGSVLAGFDFSFSYPRWFVESLGCTTVRELWEVVFTGGERWLQTKPVPDPFYGKDGKKRPPDLVQDRRACEAALGAASPFLLAGPKQVGTGTIRGMPFLAELAARGWSIWPFDAPTARTVVEVYPARCGVEVEALTAQILPDAWRPLVEMVRDAADATCAAVAMWRQQGALDGIERAAIDPLEGAIWPATTLLR